MILAIFLYIAYVYIEMFTCLNGIFTCLGCVDIDFFYLWYLMQFYSQRYHYFTQSFFLLDEFTDVPNDGLA